MISRFHNDERVVVNYRLFTIEDILATRGQSHFHFLDRRGFVRVCRANGALRTWKTDPQRFERGFKYGMYEHFRMNTKQMCESLIVIL